MKQLSIHTHITVYTVADFAITFVIFSTKISNKRTRKTDKSVVREKNEYFCFINENKK